MMRGPILSFVLGVFLLQCCAELPAPATLCAALALAVCCALLRRAMPCALLAGFGWAALLAHLALGPELSKAGEGQDVTLVGTIDSLPFVFGDGVRFNFLVEQVKGAPFKVPPRVSLAWYAGFRNARQEIGDVQPGERWQLTVRLQRPHGNANPYGFDYEVYLLEQGVRATGYVRPDGTGNRRLDSFVFSFGNVVEACRARLRERILRALPGKPYAGVIVALVVGDQRGIEQSDWRVFNRTGIGHLISISGLHITMVAGLCACCASFLWRRSRYLPLVLPAQKVAAVAAAATALLYVLLAGFGVPAQRTLYMLCVVAVALWYGRLTSVSHVLCSALGVVVLLDPWAVLWPGFWLSFGAVAAILFASVGRTGLAQGNWRAAMHVGARTQYAVTVGLVPLTMLLFAQVSLVSPVANAMAIPLVSFVVTPLALVGSVMPTAIPLQLAHLCIEALANALAYLSTLPMATWNAPTPGAWVFALALAGTSWMLAPRGWPLRWLGACSWLPLLAGAPSQPLPGQVEVVALDIGQGMALLVETAGHRLLYDTGPIYSPVSNAGNRVILPYLHARGIDAIDTLLVSHSDSDHSGGALAVMDGIRVGAVLSSLEPGHPIVRAAPHHAPCVAGQSWRWDGVLFEMLHPTASSYDDSSLKPNARGCVLRVSAGGHAILLAADIEAAQEAQLVRDMPGMLRADVLLAPHHGSGTSSTPPFLAAVKPSIALFQVGYRNRYHHPQAAVYARYGELGIERLRTDDGGALSLHVGSEVDASAYRNTHQRYWYGR